MSYSSAVQCLMCPQIFSQECALCLTSAADWGFLCCRYLISQHPEVEARILEELDGAGLLMSAQRPSPRKLARDDVACPHQLPYLKAALKVSLLFTRPSPCCY